MLALLKPVMKFLPLPMNNTPAQVTSKQILVCMQICRNNIQRLSNNNQLTLFQPHQVTVSQKSWEVTQIQFKLVLFNNNAQRLTNNN